MCVTSKTCPKPSPTAPRWRSAGKLPRCGWMDDSVPESPAWTDLAPEREAERKRLEEKRKTALGQASASINSR